jgi:hypothetical protein
LIELADRKGGYAVLLLILILLFIIWGCKVFALHSPVTTETALDGNI